MIILSKDGNNPEDEYDHCRNAQRMSIERVDNISPEQPWDRVSQSTSRAPVEAHIVQGAEAVALIHRACESESDQRSNPDKSFEMPSGK